MAAMQTLAQQACQLTRPASRVWSTRVTQNKKSGWRHYDFKSARLGYSCSIEQSGSASFHYSPDWLGLGIEDFVGCGKIQSANWLFGRVNLLWVIGLLHILTCVVHVLGLKIGHTIGGVLRVSIHVIITRLLVKLPINFTAKLQLLQVESAQPLKI